MSETGNLLDESLFEPFFALIMNKAKPSAFRLRPSGQMKFKQFIKEVFYIEYQIAFSLTG